MKTIDETAPYREILDPATQTEECVAFCEANGLDATKIPAIDGLRIYGRVIRYREFAEPGRPDDSDKPMRTEWRETRLVSQPHDHGLAAIDVRP